MPWRIRFVQLSSVFPFVRPVRQAGHVRLFPEFGRKKAHPAVSELTGVRPWANQRPDELEVVRQWHLSEGCRDPIPVFQYCQELFASDPQEPLVDHLPNLGGQIEAAHIRL